MVDERLRTWCRANWDKVPEMIRRDCLDHLEAEVPAEALRSWKRNGYDNGLFHFSGGMAVRNILRDQLLDQELPVVTEDQYGKPYGPSHNWDDYYTGALDELLERY